MAYDFDTQAVASMKSTISGSSSTTEHQISGVNGREADANIIMGGLSTMYNIVDWHVVDSTRTVKQDVIDTE